MEISHPVVILILSSFKNTFSHPYNRHGKDFALFFAISDYEEWSDLAEPVKAITPAQAQVKIKRTTIPENVLQPLYGKEPTVMKLKRDDGTKAKEIFSRGKL